MTKFGIAMPSHRERHDAVVEPAVLAQRRDDAGRGADDDRQHDRGKAEAQADREAAARSAR